MSNVIVRPLREADLPEADRIFRLAFGTFLRMPDPMQFAGDADFVGMRFRTWPEAALAAERDGELLGSIFSVRRGSSAFFGPLTVRPDAWEGGIAKRLVAATVDVYDRWGIRHGGLFTFADSAKHVALYQKFGFWPVSLMSLLALPLGAPSRSGARAEALSDLPAGRRAAAHAACRAVAGALYPGLDASDEISALSQLGIGDVALVRDADEVLAFAVCHAGKGSEAESGSCLVKLGIVRPDAASPATFDRLLDACAAVAERRGARVLLVGVDLGCRAAYRRLLERGFRTQMQGVAMHRPDDAGYFSPEAYVLGDWR